ncbi:MAG: rRNA maturation RNase YbeY [Pseudomonadota bacterium]
MSRLPLVVECIAPAHMRAPSRRSLAKWANAALGARGQGKELALKLVSQPQMRALNRHYRGKDKPTNVLAFPAVGAQGAIPQPLGDVVICPAVLRREAQAQGKTLQAHWAHLVVHGTLHLAGFDHEVQRDAQRMERREIAVLRSLGFNNPYV